MGKGRGQNKQNHKITYESLVTFGCTCGFRWHNEHLRGKSDYDLNIEREEAFASHQWEMEKQGF